MRGSDILTLCLLIIQLNLTNSSPSLTEEGTTESGFKTENSDLDKETNIGNVEKDKLGDEEEEDLVAMEINRDSEKNNLSNELEKQNSVEERGAPSTSSTENPTENPGDTEEVTKGKQVEKTVSVNNNLDRYGRKDSIEATLPDKIAENTTERSMKEPTEDLSSRAGNNQTTCNVSETDETTLVTTTLPSYSEGLSKMENAKEGVNLKSSEIITTTTTTTFTNTTNININTNTITTTTTMKVDNPDDIQTATTLIEDELTETNPAEVITSTSNVLMTESPEENTIKEIIEVETATEQKVSSDTTTENQNTPSTIPSTVQA